jgi:hypothetical protein
MGAAVGGTAGLVVDIFGRRERPRALVGRQRSTRLAQEPVAGIGTPTTGAGPVSIPIDRTHACAVWCLFAGDLMPDFRGG